LLLRFRVGVVGCGDIDGDGGDVSVVNVVGVVVVVVVDVHGMNIVDVVVRVCDGAGVVV